MTHGLETDAGGRRGWSSGAILFSVIFCLAACAAFLATRAIPPVLGFGFLAALPLMRDERAVRPGLLLLFALVLLLELSLVWTPAPFDPTDLERLTPLKLLLMLVGCGGLCLAALRLPSAAAERAALVLAFSLVGLAVILVFEGVTDAAFYMWLSGLVGEVPDRGRAVRNVAQGGYVLAVLAWPAAMILRREGLTLPVLVVVAGVVAAMVSLGADAPAAALAAGLIGFLAVMALGRPAVLAIGGAMSVLWLAAPWLVLAAARAGLWAKLAAGLPESWGARLNIWAFVAERVAERPLLGWGVDAARTFKEIPLHPHSAPLQYWFEAGAPGALLGAAFWYWLFRVIARPSLERGFAAACVATLLSFLFISCVSFNAWEEWWLGAGVIGLLALIALGRFWAVEAAFKDPVPPPSA